MQIGGEVGGSFLVVISLWSSGISRI